MTSRQREFRSLALSRASDAYAELARVARGLALHVRLGDEDGVRLDCADFLQAVRVLQEADVTAGGSVVDLVKLIASEIVKADNEREPGAEG